MFLRMTYRMCQLIVVVMSLLAARTGLAQGGASFNGIYAGDMQLQDGDGLRQIPLQVSLVLTGETVERPNGEHAQIIDGSFLVDGEGGAFPFYKVIFTAANARIDMQYTRPATDIGNETPSSFRLIGRYRSDGSMEGQVLSANRGPLGTFKVAKTNRVAFAKSNLYTGRWQGFAVFPQGGEVSMSLQLLNAEGSTVNPLELEFAYTPGKLAHVRWNNLTFSITNVTIDYLRRVITLRKLGNGSDSTLSIEFSIDQTSKEARGVIKSAYRGEIARFALPSVASVINP